MNITDILILVILVLPALVGVVYGFLNILLSIIAWVLALGVSLKFGRAIAPVFENHIEMPLIRDILAFVVLFIISLVVFTALGYIVIKLLGRASLTAMDRLLGSFFGAALGCGIVAILVFLAGYTSVSEADWWQDSSLIQPFERFSVWARQFLPDNVVEYHRYAD